MAASLSTHFKNFLHSQNIPWTQEQIQKATYIWSNVAQKASIMNIQTVAKEILISKDPQQAQDSSGSIDENFLVFRLKEIALMEGLDRWEAEYKGNKHKAKNAKSDVLEAFKNNYKSLHLNSLDLISIPPVIGLLTQLTELNLEFNHLTFLPDEISQLLNLTSLNVRDNNLSTLPLKIANLKKLERLNLSENAFEEIPEGVFQLTQLKGFEIENNKLRNIPEGIGNLINLGMIRVGNNQITSISPQIGQLVNLYTLEMNNNKLETLPEEICQLKKVGFITLAHNHLRFLPSEIGNLDRMSTFYIDNNRLTSLSKSFRDLTTLYTFSFSNNHFESLPLDLFLLPNLGTVYFEENPLRDVPLNLAQTLSISKFVPPKTLNPPYIQSLKEQMDWHRYDRIPNLQRKLKSWTCLGESKLELKLLETLNDNQNLDLLQWLVSLEKEEQFSHSQTKLARVVCRVLEEVFENNNFKDQFFETNKNDLIFSLNELYLSCTNATVDSDLLAHIKALESMRVENSPLRSEVLDKFLQNPNRFPIFELTTSLYEYVEALEAHQNEEDDTVDFSPTVFTQLELTPTLITSNVSKKIGQGGQSSVFQVAAKTYDPSVNTMVDRVAVIKLDADEKENLIRVEYVILRDLLSVLSADEKKYVMPLFAPLVALKSDNVERFRNYLTTALPNSNQKLEIVEKIIQGRDLGSSRKFSQFLAKILGNDHPLIKEIIHNGCNGMYSLAGLITGLYKDTIKGAADLPISQKEKLGEHLIRSFHVIHSHGFFLSDMKSANSLYRLKQPTGEEAILSDYGRLFNYGDLVAKPELRKLDQLIDYMQNATPTELPLKEVIQIIDHLSTLREQFIQTQDRQKLGLELKKLEKSHLIPLNQFILGAILYRLVTKEKPYKIVRCNQEAKCPESMKSYDTLEISPLLQIALFTKLNEKGCPFSFSSTILSLLAADKNQRPNLNQMIQIKI